MHACNLCLFFIWMCRTDFLFCQINLRFIVFIHLTCTKVSVTGHKHYPKLPWGVLWVCIDRNIFRHCRQPELNTEHRRPRRTVKGTEHTICRVWGADGMYLWFLVHISVVSTQLPCNKLWIENIICSYWIIRHAWPPVLPSATRATSSYQSYQSYQ